MRKLFLSMFCMSALCVGAAQAHPTKEHVHLAALHTDAIHVSIPPVTVPKTEPLLVNVSPDQSKPYYVTLMPEEIKVVGVKRKA